MLVKTLEEKVFITYGAPSIIISDNGSQFKSKLYSDLASKYKTALWYTPFFCPRANAAEAANKIIGNAIRSYIRNDSEQRVWDKNISAIMTAMNTALHTATNETPYEIVFGRKFVLSGHASVVKTNENETHLEKWNTLHENVSKQLRQAYEKAKKRYDLRTREITFSVGDVVYRRNYRLSDKAAGYTSKLAPRYIKAVIIEKLGKCVFRVKDVARNTVGTYHTKDLKKMPALL